MQLRLADFADARVAVWGYGREGRAAIAALHRTFPDKPLTLFCSAQEATAMTADRIAANRGNSGQHAEAAGVLNIVTAPPDVDALREFDIVIKSPGISPYRQPAASALRAGVRFSSGSAIWFAEHPHARTICVTGTKGKSTVSALIAHLLRRSGKIVALAGNIGLSLLDVLSPPHEPDWWVIELSSFQTHDFGGSPTVAVVNNLYEEHLDWHGTRERYRADKLAIATYARTLVVNAQDELLSATQAHASRHVFGRGQGWRVGADAVCRGDAPVLPLSAIPLPGMHNALNVCAALAAIEAAGLDAAAAAPHVATFKGLPHRLQSLGTREGIEYINDSIATTPYAAIEALRSVAGRDVSVLVGGFDRGVDWQPFVDHVRVNPPRAIVAMGANGAAIADALRGLEAPGFRLEQCIALDDAMARARTLTPAGGVVLMSPGAASFDAFRDYAERGREFARLAGFDPAAIAQIDGLGIA